MSAFSRFSAVHHYKSAGKLLDFILFVCYLSCPFDRVRCIRPFPT